ncbi:helix-turn-helix domain-containing protein [Macrococcoides caseolyticum]|uniref:helix-turn-helix domain-containing protein n=1 Tax=Macrococcoides caseolyticum TaxID=69966 RepID=UPI001F267AFD|nr:helix-turn-helix domain-containing protein [Macrococcus caseolyticus]MCE4957321.1 helix-turn-helix transcriptional regulator [Macrococcus caseolyticus]
MGNELLKLLIDEKANQIIQLTRDKAMTTKELAKALDVKTSNLYYPIKKLLEVDALKIVEERQIKNMTEYYYSSEHLNNAQINFDFPSIKDNFDTITAFYTLEIQKVYELLKRDAEQYGELSEEELQKIETPNSAQMSNLEVQLPYEQWMELMNEMRALSHKYEEKYKDAENKNTYQIQLSAYKDEQQ